MALASMTLEIFGTPHPHVLEVLDPRPYLDAAARILARFGNIGWLVAEAITAALHHARQLWFGNERNVGLGHREIAADLGVDIRIAR